MEQFNIKNFSFSYPSCDLNTLNNINLLINKGEYICLCGKSGSGKTTLLKHLKTTLSPFGKVCGSIDFEGIALNEVDLRCQTSQIGYVMQNPDHQIVTDKVWHELAFGLESLGYEKKVIRAKVAEMANYFGIQNWFHKDVNELSGGQKQLLNLASVMVMNPSVLILDEPTSQLDPIAASDFLNTIRKINLDFGITIIISEHRLEEIYGVADRIVIMEKGEIIANDTPHNVGQHLKSQNSVMLQALPSPMQIYYQLEDGKKCPLSIKEGRNYLSENYRHVSNQSIEVQPYTHDFDKDNSIISMHEIWFRYHKDGDDVLKGLSMHVAKNQIFTIVGGNGSGKSTALKVLSGIIKPYRGQVYFNGKNVKKFNNKHVNMVMLPQDPLNLFVKKTIKEDLLEMLDANLTKPDIDKIIDDIASLCQIKELLNKHVYDISGGEQQRAALAKVLLTNPDILLLDEPTKGIDIFFKLKLGEILKTLTKKGVTIILVSHDIEFCAKYADTVSLFFDGDLITTNKPHNFFAQNNFYTTAANRMSRHIFENVISNEELVTLCQMPN